MMKVVVFICVFFVLFCFKIIWLKKKSKKRKTKYMYIYKVLNVLLIFVPSSPPPPSKTPKSKAQPFCLELSQQKTYISLQDTQNSNSIFYSIIHCKSSSSVCEWD